MSIVMNKDFVDVEELLKFVKNSSMGWGNTEIADSVLAAAAAISESEELKTRMNVLVNEAEEGSEISCDLFSQTFVSWILLETVQQGRGTELLGDVYWEE